MVTCITFSKQKIISDFAIKNYPKTNFNNKLMTQQYYFLQYNTESFSRREWICTTSCLSNLRIKSSPSFCFRTPAPFIKKKLRIKSVLLVKTQMWSLLLWNTPWIYNWNIYIFFLCVNSHNISLFLHLQQNQLEVRWFFLSALHNTFLSYCI